LIVFNVPPFNEAKPEAQIISRLFVDGIGVTALVTLGFYLFTLSAVFGLWWDGFITAAGFLIAVAGGIFTGQWI
jgi:hypothetical protein